MTSGGHLAAFALTEPNAGSDAAAVRTTAVLDEETGEYVLNGTKCFISGGGQAKYLLIFALTDPSKGVKGLSCILVEKGTPGFTVGKIENKMGIHGSETAELIFDQCRVPKENLVGKEGAGFKMAMNALDGARIGVAAQALGIAEGALDESVKYMNVRKTDQSSPGSSVVYCRYGYKNRVCKMDDLLCCLFKKHWSASHKRSCHRKIKCF